MANCTDVPAVSEATKGVRKMQIGRAETIRSSVSRRGGRGHVHQPGQSIGHPARVGGLSAPGRPKAKLASAQSPDTAMPRHLNGKRVCGGNGPMSV